MGRTSPETIGWVCPACGRLFGRARQSHDYEPGLTLEEYFAAGPAHERWVAVWFPLLRVARHRTITRAVQRQGAACWHVANVATPADIDDGLRDLLSEAYRTV